MIHRSALRSIIGQTMKPVAWADIATRSMITLMNLCDSLLFLESKPEEDIPKISYYGLM